MTNEFRPDVLNPHCSPGHTYLGMLSVRRRAPLVRTVAEPRAPRSHWFSRQLYAQRTSALIFTSQSSQRRAETALGKLPARAVTILPGFLSAQYLNGVQRRDLRTELGLSEDVRILGVIARMSPEKGQEVLLEALAHLTAQERSRLFVVLAGEDSRERGQADLQRLAEQVGVAERVRFFGRLDDVRPIMSALDAGVITSTSSEAICRVALEYMSCGLPVITSDVNILPEVVLHDRTGLVYRNHDATGLAGHLRTLLLNRAEGARFGQAGLSRVRSELSLEGEVLQYLEIFESVLQQQRSS